MAILGGSLSIFEGVETFIYHSYWEGEHPKTYDDFRVSLSLCEIVGSNSAVFPHVRFEAMAKMREKKRIE